MTWAAALACAAMALAACDTGDGKTLPEPTGTVAPPTLPSTTTVLPAGGSDTLASVPLDSFDLDDIEELPASDLPFSVVAPWIDGGPIDVINTCDGADLAPAISWTDVPEGTVELAVSLIDESIADGPPFVHWVMAGLDPADISLSEGTTPLGAIRGLNFFGNVGYNGPCPPPGDPAHTYRLTIYALNQQVELADGTAAADLLDFVQTVSIGSADVTGTAQR